ncbi:MAG TPA: Sec-independent protein translocase protein TatB [Pyrinomonadaceae bacterium]|nr:Sec-independent protein translocase protein TatB [Pyrinomonadaceae bacterium]
MQPFLLIFEFLGTTEMLVIAVVALVVFGPRRLPEIGRTVGKSLAEFRRASEDFRRTWEREVEVERIERDLRIDKDVGAALSEVNDAVARSVGRGPTLPDARPPDETDATAPPADDDERADADADATRLDDDGAREDAGTTRRV